METTLELPFRDVEGGLLVREGCLELAGGAFGVLDRAAQLDLGAGVRDRERGDGGHRLRPSQLFFAEGATAQSVVEIHHAESFAVRNQRQGENTA